MVLFSLSSFVKRMTLSLVVDVLCLFVCACETLVFVLDAMCKRVFDFVVLFLILRLMLSLENFLFVYKLL